MHRSYPRPYRQRRPGQRLRILLSTGLGAAVLGGLTPTGLTGLGHWLSPQAPLRVAQALVVPQGDPGFANTSKAVEHYHRGLAQWLVFSGRGDGGDSALAMSRFARQAGVPAAAILIEEQATSVRESLTKSMPLLQRHGIRSVLLIGPPYQLRRLGLAAEAAWPGVTVQTCRNDEPFDEQWWRHRAGWRTVALETEQLVRYAAAGWLWLPRPSVGR